MVNIFVRKCNLNDSYNIWYYHTKVEVYKFISCQSKKSLKLLNTIDWEIFDKNILLLPQPTKTNYVKYLCS